MHPILVSVLAFINLSLLATAAAVDANPAATCASIEVRKEWRAFTQAEQKAWITAVNCLSKLPHESWLTPSIRPGDIPAVKTQSSLYDDIVYIHMDMNQKIHGTGLFFPWHRWYLWAFTNALKTKCSYTGVTPYWDWSKDNADYEHSSTWWNTNNDYGLGGWGDPNKDYTVPNGGFRNFTISYPSSHVLRRRFTPFPWQGFGGFPGLDPNMRMEGTFSPAQVNAVVNGNTGDFPNFQYSIEKVQGMHGSIHLGTGGDLGGTCPANAPAGCIGGPTWSVNDPIFFMHHGNIDRLWWLWQTRSSQNLLAFKGGSVASFDPSMPNGGPPNLNVGDTMATDGWGTPLKISDVLDTQSTPLCYSYA